MKAMTQKMTALVNKFAVAMECPAMRQIPLWIADREVELIAIIILAKFALMSATMQGYRAAVITAIIITVIGYICKCVATVQATLEAIDDYHEWLSRKDAYNAYATFMRNLREKAQAEEAANAAEKNQE